MGVRQTRGHAAAVMAIHSNGGADAKHLAQRPDVRRKFVGNLVAMAQRAERGIPKAEAESIIEKVAAGSSMPRGKVRAELIPDSSWKRAGKVLGPQASQTAARLSRVFAFAEKVWGNEKDAADWMNRPHMELGGATPYSMLRTEAGGHAVENVLVALEYGFPV